MCHINKCNCFVVKCVLAKETKLAHCPTGDILASFCTKPLWSLLVKHLLDNLMNMVLAADHLPEPRSVCWGTWKVAFLMDRQ